MTAYNTITTTSASKALNNTKSRVFDDFCELMIRVFIALEEEEWSENLGWDTAFGQSVSDAETAWKLVAAQAETVSSATPLSMDDLLLHRLAGLISSAVSAPSVAVLEVIQERSIHAVAHAPAYVAAAVQDLAHEAQLCIDQLIEHAHANGPLERPYSGAPVAC
ncbi:hypothetical protein OO012_18710 [Rhodobacteraceae bacterium KMM 6894]|nr:hypothetical protein [Rhodobacteraceae bacterium KMM 6894]